MAIVSYKGGLPAWSRCHRWITPQMLERFYFLNFNKRFSLFPSVFIYTKNVDQQFEL